MNISTRDITFASYLRARGYPLTSITCSGRNGVFHFNDVPEEVQSQYDLGQAMCEPQAFHSALKSLTQGARNVLRRGDD